MCTGIPYNDVAGVGQLLLHILIEYQVEPIQCKLRNAVWVILILAGKMWRDVTESEKIAFSNQQNNLPIFSEVQIL